MALVSTTRFMGAKRQGTGIFSWYGSWQLWHGSGSWQQQYPNHSSSHTVRVAVFPAHKRGSPSRSTWVLRGGVEVITDSTNHSLFPGSSLNLCNQLNVLK